MEQRKPVIEKKEKQRLVFTLIASLTLGLAPFFPEPHLIGKWRWFVGGAVGMQPMDWFDLLLHSAPWAALLILDLLNASVGFREYPVSIYGHLIEVLEFLAEG